jgi:hypothetical protein
VSRNLDCPAFIVYPALLSPMHTADSQHLGLVEVRHGLSVLTLLILDYELVARVVGIHGKGATSTITAGVAHEPIKAMLATRTLSEDRIAQVNHVALVGVSARASSRGHRHRRLVL